MAVGHYSLMPYSARRNGWQTARSSRLDESYRFLMDNRELHMNAKHILAVAVAATLLSACTATTSLRSTDPDLAIKINQDAPLVLKNPVSKTYKATSFGQYRFRAEKPGMEPMYGLIPLKFNSGYLVADILFFAPAAFYNLREVYPFYEFDVEKNEVRYKKNAGDQWTVYKPTPAEVARAQAYFAN